MEIMRQISTETKGGIRKLLFIFGLSGILLLATLSGAIVMKKYVESLYATLDRLQEFNIQYIKVRAAIDDIEKSSIRLESMLPGDSSGRSKEEHMLMALDDLKSRAGSSEIVVSNIEDKGIDLQLAVTIRAPMKDYTSLVNFVGYLQSLKFPFFGIAGMKIQRNDDPNARVTSFEIKGALKFPKTTLGAQEGAIKRVPGKL
ncbi:MAG: hypothetical protein H6Q54_850 [Deltaproteobacteria bacterium]|nr:hypothetical protein [Deltaproteobacteria bacterium]